MKLLRMISLTAVVALAACGRQIDKKLVAGAENGDIAEIKRLVANGADVNANVMDDLTPLNVAVRNGQIEAVKTLLAARASVNQGDSNNNTPIFWAAVFHKYEIAEVLISAGADPHAKNSLGRDAVWAAAKDNDAKMLEILEKKTGRSSSVVGYPGLGFETSDSSTIEVLDEGHVYDDLRRL